MCICCWYVLFIVDPCNNTVVFVVMSYVRISYWLRLRFKIHRISVSTALISFVAILRWSQGRLNCPGLYECIVFIIQFGFVLESGHFRWKGGLPRKNNLFQRGKQWNFHFFMWNVKNETHWVFLIIKCSIYHIFQDKAL